MWNSAHDLYLEDRILSADPLELVRLLYDAAITAVGDARHALTRGDIPARSRAISKACAVVIELNAALDHARGGELSRRLAALYGYLLRHLMDAHLQQSDALLAEVLSLFSTLADGWKEIQKPPDAPEVTSAWSLPAETVGAGATHAWSV
jgi:flagellar protein FliS